MIAIRAALRLGEAPQVAFVGAGGKSLVLFSLARQFDRPVLISTSTHLSKEQVSSADRHIVLDEVGQIQSLGPNTLPLISVVTSAEFNDDRFRGPSDEILGALSKFARKHAIPLLIEADGSRLRALKAPAGHEPAIPSFVDAVIVVAGMSAVGKALADENVHRAQHFSTLSGIKIGERISSKEIVKVLLNENGGLKNIPPDARRIVLLNQADSSELEAACRGISRELLSVYDAVWVAALQKIPDLSSVYEPVAGILLAAGESKRFGRPKALLDWKGKSFVRQIIETALKAGLDPLFVIAGADADNVEKEVSGLPVRLVRNTNWQQGQSSSVKAGLAALPRETGAVLFLVVDQPQLPVSIIEALVAEHAVTFAPIVAPMVDDHRTNPVLFDRSTFSDFNVLEGDVGGRAIFSRHKVRWLPWMEASLAIDVDSPEDYQRLQNLAG